MLQAYLAFSSLQLGPVCFSSESAPAAAETSVVNYQMSLPRAYMHHFVPVVYTWSELQMNAVHEKNPTVAHVSHLWAQCERGEFSKERGEFSCQGSLQKCLALPSLSLLNLSGSGHQAWSSNGGNHALCFIPSFVSSLSLLFFTKGR